MITAKKTWGELEVLGAPYYGLHDGKDQVREYFSPETDFMIEVGDRRPVIYYHGLSPEGKELHKPELIGVATYTRKDDKGLWFSIQLNKGKKLARRMWKAAKEGIARASSGSINYLVRKGGDGEILSWPLSELTLLDEGGRRHVANELAVVNLKSLYDEAELSLPKVFAESADALKAEPVVDETMQRIEEMKNVVTIASSAAIMVLAKRKL